MNTAVANQLFPYSVNKISPVFEKPVFGQSKRPKMSWASILADLIADAGHGLWTLDLPTMKIEMCPVARGICGISPDENINLKLFAGTLTRGSKMQLLKNYKRACKGLGILDLELQLENTGSEKKWIRVTARVYNPQQGREGYLIGLLMDINEVKVREMATTEALALFTHEMKGPISAARLYVQLAEGMTRELKQNNCANILAKADRQISNIVELMDDLLSASGQHDGHYNCEEADLVSMIYEIVGDMQLQYPGRSFEMQFSGRAYVNCDRLKIGQVINNYLTNAVKYSPAGSPVTITCRLFDHTAVVSVTDCGPGIPVSLHKKVFDRYFRVPGTREKGMGLGLYIAREIITHHGGQVGVQNTTAGGSSFFFDLPAIKSTVFPERNDHE